MAHNYPELSTANLVLFGLSFPIAGLMITTDTPWVVAVGFIIPPFLAFCWIFTTIRGLHQTGNRFWGLASTWVSIVVGLLVATIALFTYLTVARIDELHQNPNHITGWTVYLGLSIVYGAVVGWGVVYNYRKSGSVLLAINLTLLQSFIVAVVIGIINLFISRRNINDEAASA